MPAAAGHAMIGPHGNEGPPAAAAAAGRLASSFVPGGVMAGEGVDVREAAGDPRAPVAYPFTFTGRAGEYFRIWIVNLALSVVTFGIFSAWAKVRQQRWFYGNTWVADAPFEYLAPPLAVLKGRIIAVGVLVAYVLVSQFLPVAEGPLLLLLVLATPWLILSGLRFRARYSAWRTINFSFDNDVYDAGSAYLLYPIALAPTLGLAFPWVRQKQAAFTVEGHLLGPDRLELTATSGDFYRAYARVALLALGLVLIIGVLLAGLVQLVAALVTDFYQALGEEQREIVIGLATLAAVYVLVVAFSVVASARITNLRYNHIRVGGHSFRSTLRARDLLTLYLTNTLAVLLSLGLLIPWAQVRMARYRAAHTVLVSERSPLEARARHRAGQAATGAEVADVMDVDLSL
jgi:uncharacterized membrane protein YjgN (DUF898 family)